MSPEEKQRRKDEAKSRLEEEFPKEAAPTSNPVVLPGWMWEEIDARAEKLAVSRGQLLYVWLDEKLKLERRKG